LAKTFEFKWGPQIEAIRRNIAGLGERLPDLIRDHLRDNAEKSRDQLQQLTPRSEFGTDHLADHWEDADVSTPGQPLFRVRNESTRVDRDLVLAVLEYGTTKKDYPITPNDPGGVLFFVKTGTGERVFTKRVSHPGISPYGMMRKTKEAAQERMTVFVETKLSKEAQRIWSGRLSATTGGSA